MSNDLLIPMLVCAGCLTVICFVYIKTRPKRTPRTFSIPKNQAAKLMEGNESDSGSSDQTTFDQGLSSWHDSFESTVLDFIEFADELIETIDNEIPLEEISDIDVFETEKASLFQRAASEHPSPEMGAELAAMLATASASLHAYLRGDLELAKQQRSSYREYREMWFQRLRQFPQDIDRIIRLRQT